MRNSFFSSLNAYPWNHLLFCLIPLAVVLALFASLVGTGDQLTLYFKDMRRQNPVFTDFVHYFSSLGNYLLYIFYAALLAAGIRKKDKSQIKQVFIFTAVQICIAALLVQCIKIAVGSPRPIHALTNPHNMPFTFNGVHHSFPSGHTTEVVNAAGTLAVWFRKNYFSAAMGVFIALMGSSRIYLSQHRLSDVLAGMVLGSAASVLVHFFCSREYRYDYPFRQISR